MLILCYIVVLEVYETDSAHSYINWGGGGREKGKLFVCMNVWMYVWMYEWIYIYVYIISWLTTTLFLNSPKKKKRKKKDDLTF